MAFKKLWFWKPNQLNDLWAEVHAFSTDEFDRPSIITSEQKPTIADPVWFGSLDADGDLFINWRDADIEGITPPLWYIIQEANSPYPGGPKIPFIFIHAMHGDDFPSGTIIHGKKFLELGMKITASGAGNSERVGYLQWWREDSKIQQIRVEEKWRRKRITLALFGVADLVIVAGGYGPFLYGGDVTTGDGETLRKAWEGSNRVIPRNGSVS